MAGTMPTWEQVVDRVTISSNHLAVRFAESKWRAAFRQSLQAAQWIREMSDRNAQSWKGPGAEAFRTHLQALAKVLDDNASSHLELANCLQRCADALETAVKTIPVPSWKIAEVKQAQLDFALNGMPANIQPYEFWQDLMAKYPDGWTASTLQQAEEIFRNAESRAQQIYQRLCEVYREQAAKMPEGTPLPVPGVNKPVGAGKADTGGAADASQTAAQQRLTTPSTNTQPPATAPGGLTNPPPLDTSPGGTPPLTDIPDLDHPDGLDTSPSDFGLGGLGSGDFGRGTSLAGIGGGGLGGAGTLGDGAGIGSIAGLGSPGMGPAVSPPPGVIAARAGGAGTGAGTGVMPFAPMTGGQGVGDSGQQTRTAKICEDDEDIFGPRQASSCVIDV